MNEKDGKDEKDEKYGKDGKDEKDGKDGKDGKGSCWTIACEGRKGAATFLSLKSLTSVPSDK